MPINQPNQKQVRILTEDEYKSLINFNADTLLEKTVHFQKSGSEILAPSDCYGIAWSIRQLARAALGMPLMKSHYRMEEEKGL